MANARIRPAALAMPSPTENFARARARRESLRAGDAHGPTDALRLLDGRGDGPEFAGLTVEDLAGRWLVSAGAERTMGSAEWLKTCAPAPRSIYWKHLHVKEKQPPQWWHGERVDGPFEVQENGLRFRVDLAAGYSQGLFLDQRDNRAAVRARVESGRVRRVLNLFAYTCGFSVAAAAGGAHTTSVDLSRASLDWGCENFRLNHLDPTAHEFLAGDVAGFLRRLERRGRRFDLIILDPPTFSRDRQGKIFRVEHDFGHLAAAAARLLPADGSGELLCSTNLRALPPGGLRRLLLGELAGGWQTRPASMPPDFTGEPYLQALWLRRRG